MLGMEFLCQYATCYCYSRSSVLRTIGFRLYAVYNTVLKVYGALRDGDVSERFVRKMGFFHFFIRSFEKVKRC